MTNLTEWLERNTERNFNVRKLVTGTVGKEIKQRPPSEVLTPAINEYTCD